MYKRKIDPSMHKKAGKNANPLLLGPAPEINFLGVMGARVAMFHNVWGALWGLVWKKGLISIHPQPL